MLLQAYFSAGNFFLQHIVVERGIDFYPYDCMVVIREAEANHFQLENTVAHKVSIKGMVYKKNINSML